MSLSKAVLFFAALSAAAQTVIEPRVVSETLPSGGLMQIKLDFTSPHPITTTSSDFSFDSAFESVEGVSILSPSGDAYGVGYARNARFHANIVSPLASLGTQLDYPFLMVAAKIRSGIPAGTVIPISFGTATFFNGPGGAPYSLPAPKNGALTIGGSASITNIVPGGGVLPAGTTVRILGTGFNSTTRIDVNEVKVSNFRYVSPTEIDFTMSASGDLTGTRFVLRGQNKDPDVTYFSYLRAVAVGSSSRALLNGCHPLYPTQLLTSAGIAVPATGLNGFIGIALRNSSSVSSDVQLELVSSAGASLGKVSVNIPSGGQYLRTVQELFGPAPAGAAVKVTASVAIQALGLNGDDTNGNVSAFLPGPAPAVTSAALAAAPTSLTFDAVSGAAAPAAKNVSITSTGAASTFASSSNAAWLTATPSTGSTPGSVSVSVNPAGLAAGAYAGTLTFTATGVTTVTVPVTLNIALPSQLSVGPAALTFTAVAGAAAPPSKPLSVSTIGAALSFTAATNAAWLSALPASGTTPATVTVSVNPAGLAAGIYSSQINLTAPGASPQTVAVTFTVTAAPLLTLSPASLTFTAAGTQSVSIGSTGTALPYTTSSNAAWLTALPAAGTTPGTLSISVNPTSLAPGSYTGLITVTPTGAAAQSVSVTLTLAPPAQLSLSPSALMFDGVAGAASPVSKSIAVASTASALAYSVTSSAPWLSASPASGTTPANAVVTANTAGLTVGTYSGTLTFTPPAGSTTQTVVVTLNVTPAPQLAVTPVALTFDSQTGGAAPAAKSMNVASAGTPLNFTVSSNAAWLSASPSTGATPSPVSVSVNPAGLAAGSYSGTITISAPGATAQTVAVTLNVVASPQLTLSPSALTFFGAGSQSVTVGSTGSVLSYSASSNAAWLIVSPPSGATPGALSATTNVSGLAPGTYSGLITVSAPGATTQTVAVTLTVASVSPQLTVTPASLSFDGSGVRSVSVGSTGAVLNYTAVSTAPWLTVAPAAGATPATLTLTAAASGLAPGAYSASIVISAPGAASQTVAVSLNIAASRLTFSPAALTFDAAGTKTIAVASTGAPLGFAATANVPWLTVSSSSGVTPATVSVTAVQGTLPAGAYTGAVTLTAAGAATQTIAVTFNVSTTAVPEVAALVNGASQAAGTAFAPGQIVSLYGRNLGPATGVFGTLATPSRFDTEAGGTRVRFNGVLAPVLYASTGQVNTIVPYEVSGATTVEVEFEGRRSAPIPIRIVEAAPALFTQDASGRGRAAILNQDYGLNTPQRPAARGTVVMLYATGGGQTNPASSTGQIAGSDLRTLALPVNVTIGGRLAETLYAGAAPGLVTGLLQINVWVPADAPTGDGVPVSIQVGSAASPDGTTISIN